MGRDIYKAGGRCRMRPAVAVFRSQIDGDLGRSGRAGAARALDPAIHPERVLTVL